MKLIVYFITGILMLSCMSQQNKSIQLEETQQEDPGSVVDVGSTHRSNYRKILFYTGFPFGDNLLSLEELEERCEKMLQRPFSTSSGSSVLTASTEVEEYTKEQFKYLSLKAHIIKSKQITTDEIMKEWDQRVSSVEESKYRYECYVEGELNGLLDAKNFEVKLPGQGPTPEALEEAPIADKGLIIDLVEKLFAKSNSSLAKLEKGQEWGLRTKSVNGFSSEAISTARGDQENIRSKGLNFDFKNYLAEFNDLAFDESSPEGIRGRAVVFSIDYDIVIIEDNKVIKSSETKRINILHPLLIDRRNDRDDDI